MKLFERLTLQAQANPQRLILPESTEPRTLQAADRVICNKIADVTFIGDKEEILNKAFELGLSNIEKARFVNPKDAAVVEPYAELLAELRKKKGMTIEEARKQAANPLYLGCLMIKKGEGDAMWPAHSVPRAMYCALRSRC